MTKSPRRVLSTILALALLTGLAPREAAAQVARVAVGEAGSMPVSPAGSALQNGAVLDTSLSLSGAGLQSTLHAPSIDLRTLPTTPTLVPTALNVALPAAAKPEDDKPAENKVVTPAAAKPVAKKTRNLIERLDDLIVRGIPWKGAEKKTETTNTDSNVDVDGKQLFDGSEQKSGDVEAPAVSAKPNVFSRVAASLKARHEKARARRLASIDEFGGPQKVELTGKGKIAYGLRQGLNLLGIGAILDFVVQPLLNLLPWPQLIAEHGLRAYGRVALLTHFGPNEIVSGIASAPGHFFGLTLPLAVTMEEITYRVFGFGATFLVIAAVRPVSRWLSKLVGVLPDAAGSRSIFQGALDFADRIGAKAFPIAAVMTAWSFAAAHLAVWGFSPYILLLNFVVGLFLAHAGYRSRSLLVPVVAHLTFNLVTLGAIYAALYVSPLAASVVGIVAGLVGVAALFHAWLSARKGLDRSPTGDIVSIVLTTAAFVAMAFVFPGITHLFVSLVTLGGLFSAITSWSLFTPAALLVAVVVGATALYDMARGVLSDPKASKLRKGGVVAALLALLIAAMSVLSPVGTTSNGGQEMLGRRSEVVAKVIQDKKAELKKDTTETGVTAVAPVDTTAAADTAKVESRADMIARVKPSVVNVIIHMQGGYAIGSGFILTPDGVFITNGHVVGATPVGGFVNAKVPGVDGELRAKVLAVNHDKDLAIVQLQPRPDGKPWPFVKLATTAPREGDDVTALGYPRGLPFTASHGVVSGLDDRGTMYVKKLQTDAAINPGNSGGPLFNDKGEVVGVNTEIYTQSGGSEGLGFSIQASEVAHALEQYAKTGNIATASLGVIMNFSDPQAPEAGVEIEYVRWGSAAEKAGLKRGDLIIAVGDQVIEEGGVQGAMHIASALSKLIPGQKVDVTVIRDDQPVTISVTMDAKFTEPREH